MGAVNHGESVGPGKEAPPKPKAVGRLAFQHRVHPEPVCACMYGVCVRESMRVRTYTCKGVTDTPILHRGETLVAFTENCLFSKRCLCGVSKKCLV